MIRWSVCPAQALEWMAQLALPFADQVQRDFLGWTVEDHAPLTEWTRANHAATLTQDRPLLAQLVTAFEAIVAAQLARRRAPGSVTRAGNLAASLMQEEVNEELMTDADIASNLRNFEP